MSGNAMPALAATAQASDELILRRSTALLRTDAGPDWWSGELFLTNVRVFFVPWIVNPLIADLSYPLDMIVAVAPAGRNRFRIGAVDRVVTLELTGASLTPAALAGVRARPWLEAIAQRIVRRVTRAAAK